MNEFKTKLETILRADTTLQTLLSKTATPYGIYYMKPPASPVFPLVAYKLISGPVDDADRYSQTRSLILQITAYSATNCDATMEQVEKTINEANAFSSMTTCDVLGIAIDTASMEDFDVEFNIYTRTDRYRVFLSKIPT